MKNLAPTATVVASLLLSVDAAGNKLKGCYTDVEPPLEDQGEYQYQSSGWCTGVCKDLNMPVMALWGGSNCLCGKELPPEDQMTDDDECSAPCQGTDKEMCGGLDAYSVYLTGLSGNVPVYGESSSSSSTAEPTTETTETTEATEATETSSTSEPTVTTTPSSTPDTDEEEDSGPNKGAVAGGVVAGVVAAAGLAAGVFFFLKYRKRKGVVEEYRRNATISNFVDGGGKPNSSSSMSDSRLEPNMMSQRRQSNGSIADDQDFSRRILKVTNPDSQH